ncbi:MAG TPA: glycosyltransferase [Gemmataceae bacterium]|nr:glycosyltransferase [Gemmataceae bacterium]
MKATVAVCTWNRASLLDQTLTAMRRLHIPEGFDWELLVVNNNCTDDTDAVIAKHSAALPIKRLFEPVSGQSNARNCAIQHAAGDWIVWTDDDVLVDADWLGAFAQTAARFPKAVAIGGRVEPWFPSEPDPDLLTAFHVLRIGYCGVDHGLEERPLNAGELIAGANMAYDANFARGVLFDPRFGRKKDFQGGGDDLAYFSAIQAMGALAVWSPQMLVRHYVAPERMTLAYLKRYFADAGEQEILAKGIPAGARLFGVPRWLLRRQLEGLVVSLCSRVVTNRTASLLRQRDYWLVKGMVRGCIKLRRAAFSCSPESSI